MSGPARMWVGLHTEAPTPEFDPLGLRQLAGGEFARADADGSWAAPVETVPIAVEIGPGVFYRTSITTGGNTVTQLCLADQPARGSVRMAQPTGETLIDGEGVACQVWREDSVG